MPLSGKTGRKAAPSNLPTLLLTQRFLPHTGAAARRLGWLAGQFAKAGPVYVIRMGEDGAELPEVTRTIVIPNRDLRAMTGQSGKTLPGGLKASPLLRPFLKMRQAYPFVYLTDDGGADYRSKAFKAAEKLVLEEGVTTLVSSFRPWSDHLVAAKLKEKYPVLEWFADFRDLPVDFVRKDIWWPALQRWWGRGVIASADEVWVVSEGQKAQFDEWHPRVQVLRNPLLSLPPEENNPVSDRFTIVYTGSIYPGLQSIAPLVTALVGLIEKGVVDPDKLCLRYRGNDAFTFRVWADRLLDKSLDVQPSIAPAAAQKMQEEAQVLLLLNWSAENYYGVLTAKLWDYLATGRPVLALVNGPDDQELRSIIRGAAAGVVFAEKERGLADWLARAYTQWEDSGSLPWSVDREALKKYLGSK